jgi:hypothetical protein
MVATVALTAAKSMIITGMGTWIATAGYFSRQEKGLLTLSLKM